MAKEKIAVPAPLVRETWKKGKGCLGPIRDFNILQELPQAVHTVAGNEYIACAINIQKRCNILRQAAGTPAPSRRSVSASLSLPAWGSEAGSPPAAPG